ncbi:hypothetical protein [Methylobacterium sp. 092160098-2]|uniref:hypothetical protein n=1 Tax=Methylobacterium sp. 092160098-2 TaxID=3025129 RepID=UPI002381BB27|nr:hypothetical protein [Methylobacterium sp. 092160098-2]MDE4914916.1 hypothetical protein [Methylobacterium sp. 092160098-2]
MDPSGTVAVDRGELERIAAELRHAYSHLVNGRVTDLRAFAEGLVAPQIRRIELLAGGPVDASADGVGPPEQQAAPSPR